MSLRTLTPEQFRAQPDLLYHGSTRLLDFSHLYQYGPDHFEANASSQTLGIGFYASDIRDIAGKYSLVRKSYASVGDPLIDTEIAHIEALLPYDAKMFDFRRIDDDTDNASIDADFLEKWVRFL